MKQIFTSLKYAIYIIVLQLFSLQLFAQSLPVGSYVIPMDNTLQKNTNGYFNLKSYGLIVHLLNNNVKLKWSIKAGKLKDGIDFTATTEQIQPSFVGGGVSRDFKAGPFVIYAADTAGVNALILNYNSINNLTGNNRPTVYRLTTAASNVEIRYDLSGFKPKAMILNDGSNASIHEEFMIKCSISTSNYNIGISSTLNAQCYTFTSEPHNSSPSTTTVNIVRSFVENGGNFLAQCDAIESFENHANGHFHTSNGIVASNLSINSSSVIYPKTDFTYSQYEGIFDIKVTGAVRNWTLGGGSAWKNNVQNIATGGTMAAQSPIGASVVKLTSENLAGGYVFYLGNHNFTSTTSIPSINGIRMYMNAFLTPVSLFASCTPFVILPLKYLSFDGVVSDNKVTLSWLTTQEVNTSHFEVERSFDMNHFSTIGLVLDGFASGNNKSYKYKDNSAELAGKSIAYYRLKQFDKDGKYTYSKVLAMRLQVKADAIMQVSPNPFVDVVTARFNSSENGIAIIRIINTSGQTILSNQTTISIGYNNLQIDNLSKLSTGVYIAQLLMNGVVIDNQKIIKNK